jgi:5-methyltetrahydrofolate--homocysteine methyltransferase
LKEKGKMTREEFKKLLDRGFVILDGATGTNLQNAGMPTGVCSEQWILENREIMVKLQRDFVDAGTQILYAPSFTANRLKLGDYGLEDKLRQMNMDLVAISKEAAGGRALVAGDMTMTGRQLYPMGTMQFEELVNI